MRLRREADQKKMNISDAESHLMRRSLLRRLRGRATAVGVTRLRAEVLRCNRPAQALFHEVFPDRLIRTGDHFVEMIALIGTDASWEITMEDVLADLLS
jgi:hypothetical protein